MLSELLHAQHVVAVCVQQHREPHGERRPIERAVHRDAEGRDRGFVSSAGRRSRVAREKAGRRKVRRDESQETRRVVQEGRGISQELARESVIADRSAHDGHGRIEPRDRGDCGRHGLAVRQVGLGEHDAIGRRDLVRGFTEAAKLRWRVHAIDRRHHTADAEMEP